MSGALPVDIPVDGWKASQAPGTQGEARADERPRPDGFGGLAQAGSVMCGVPHGARGACGGQQEPLNWPPTTGTAPTLRYDSKIFETKFSQESRNQYDGGAKGGEAWKVLIRGYTLGKIPMMKYLLKWAEDHATAEVTAQGLRGLAPYLDEDPFVINHLLWAFLNVNLTGKAREIFCNVGDSQGFEAWRRINGLIYSMTERRQDELYRVIHNPRSAASPQDVHGVLEEWDTNQRLFRELGGIPLRDDELRNIVLKIVPGIIRDNLIFKLKDFRNWSEVKDYIKENARLLRVYGKSTALHLAEDAQEFTEAFLTASDEKPLEQVIEELGDEATTSAILALVDRRQQRRAAQGRAARKETSKKFTSTRPPTAPDRTQARVPTSQAGRPLCSNCGEEGHEKLKCPKERLEMSRRPRFRCGKPGHTSRRCKSGLPLKTVVSDTGGEEDEVVMMVQQSAENAVPDFGRALDGDRKSVV